MGADIRTKKHLKNPNMSLKHPTKPGKTATSSVPTPIYAPEQSSSIPASET